MSRDLTASEKQYRAERSLLVAQERLGVVEHRLPEAKRELADTIVKNEVQGYLQRSVDKLRKEVESLEKERGELTSTISALREALPALQQEAKLEEVRSETVPNMRQAYRRLTELLQNAPKAEGLSEELHTLQEYLGEIHKAKSEYYALSATVAQTISAEGVENLGSVAALQADRDGLSWETVTAMADSLFALSDDLHEAAIGFYAVKDGDPATLPQAKPEPSVEEISEDGKFRRVRNGTSLWTLYRKVTVPVSIIKDGQFSETRWEQISSSISRPEWPEK